jgi:RecA-family ATPase
VDERALVAERELAELKEEMTYYEELFEKPSVKAAVMQAAREAAGVDEYQPSFVIQYPGEDWLDKDPEIQWVLPGWIPRGELTMLFGRGGHGKTKLAQQMALAAIFKKSVIGLKPNAQRVVLISAEDNHKAVRPSMAPMFSFYERSRESIGRNFAVLFVDQSDAYLNVVDRKTGATKPSEKWTREIQPFLRDFKPDLVIYDTLSHLHSGSIIDPAQATAFGGMLKREAAFGDHPHAALLLAHVSVSQSAEGNGGTLAWENISRSRLHMEMVLPEDTGTQRRGKTKPDDGKVIYRLTSRKGNRGKPGASIEFFYNSGCFVLNTEEEDTAAKRIRKADCDVEFLKLVKKANQIGQKLTMSSGMYYAPKWMVEEQDEMKDFTAEEFKEAGAGLLSEKRIVLEGIKTSKNHTTKLIMMPTPWNNRD